MKHPSKIQVELLTLISPQPYGYSLKITQAAKLLHLNYRSAKYELEKFRKTWPDRWQTIKEMKSEEKSLAPIHKRLKKSLKRPILIGAVDWADISDDPTSLKESDLLFDDEDGPGIAYLKIKERF